MSDRQRKGGGRKRRRRAPDRPGQASEQGAQPQGQRQRAQPRPAEGKEAGRRDRRGGRKGSGGGEPRRREREPRLQYRSVIVLPEAQATPCPICGKPVRDAVAAMGYGEDHAAAHFDCVMETLRANRELRPDEQLCYLGGGNFGVVRFTRGDGASPFTIHERIPYEPSHERPQWRQDLDSVTRR